MKLSEARQTEILENIFNTNPTAVPLKSPYVEVVATVTRPADTTPYSAGDAISNSTSAPTVISFSNVGAFNGQKIALTEVMITSSAKQSTLPSFNLWLFKSSPTPVNDNSAFALTDDENNTVEAVVPVYESNSAVNNSRFANYNFCRIVNLDDSATTLYALLEITNAYTPVSGEVFTITLKGERLYA